MHPPPYDVIVLGVGAMGSATCFHLASRGLRVLGIEQFDIAHDHGSSHGRSRVIRKAYFEDSRYVPLLHRTYELWRELESISGDKLLHLCGCLNVGPPEHVCVQSVKESAVQHGLKHELLDRDEIVRRWPALRPHENDVGLFEPDGGYVPPERCIRAHVAAAQQRGAVIQVRETVRSWSANNESVTVETDRGRYNARHLVITAGPWLGTMARELGLPLKVERQVQLWFAPKDRELFDPARLPVFIHFVKDRAYYGIPMYDEAGAKIARHHGGETTTPETINRSVTVADEHDVRDYIKTYILMADGPLLDAKICMYTNTPDDHFIVDRHPQHPRVLIAGGFSGHGFKFAPVIGEALRDLIVEGHTSLPINLFSLQRFRTS